MLSIVLFSWLVRDRFQRDTQFLERKHLQALDDTLSYTNSYFHMDVSST